MKNILYFFVGCAFGVSASAQNANLPKVPPELRIELFAQPPEVEAVSAVCSAPDGSVYVGCDPMDMGLNTDKPSDYIVLFRRTGANRTRTIFADKIGPIMGMAWHRGALYIVHDPYLTVLRDTDGDGVADQRENLVENLGPKVYPGLNDHIVSGFTLGMDGFFYISVGDKGVHNAKAKDGSTATIYGGGIVRVRPDGTDLEVFSTGTRNHLEVNLDAEDHAFTYDNTDDGHGWWTRVTHHIEGGFYGYPYHYKTDATNGLIQPGPQKPQPTAAALPVNELFLPAMTDYGGGSPCGGLVYLSDGLPENYRGNSLFSEWGKSTVFGFEFEREGATFKVKKQYPLIERGSAGEVRPLMLCVGHDGSVYMADWQYGGWKANHVVGRVWRLYWPDAKPVARLDDKALSQAALPVLVQLLAHPDRDQRLRAQWEIISRFSDKAISALENVLRDKKSVALQKWHAIWTLDGIGGAAPKDNKGDVLRAKAANVVRASLKDLDSSVRAQAIRALGVRSVVSSANDITPFLKDTDAEVRLQAATALGRIAEKSIASSLVGALADDDRWVRFAVRSALKRTGNWPVIMPVLSNADNRIREQAWLTFTGAYDENAANILADIVAKNPDGKVRARAVELLAQVAYQQPLWDGKWWGTQPVLGKAPAKTIAWVSTLRASRSLATALEDSDAAVRRAAVTGLSQIPAGDVLPKLRARVSIETDLEVKRAIVAALGDQKDAEAMPLLAEILRGNDGPMLTAALTAAEKIGNDPAKKAITEFLSRADLSAGELARACDVAGTLKMTVAAATLASHLRHNDSGVRVAAAKALGKIAPSNLGDTLVAVLSDTNADVKREAIKALGAMKAKNAIPALMERSKDNAVRADVILALAQMPDVRALGVYLSGVGDKNREVRDAAIKAVRAIRSEALPEVERLIAAGAIPDSAMADLEAALYSGTIQQWKIIGAFENGWQSVHDPEREVLAAIKSDKSPDLTKTFLATDGKQSAWRELKAEPMDGRVELNSQFSPNSQVLVYAYAEFESPNDTKAKLLCGSDDQIAIWFNGEKIHNFEGNRGLTVDQDQVSVALRKGKNRLLMKVGNTGGGWEFCVRLPGLDGGKYNPPRGSTKDPLQELLKAARGGKGDAAKGEKVFFEAQGAACFQCHTVRGKGTAVGPDLTDVAAKYPREELIVSVVEPSKRMAVGYEPSVVQANDGEIYSGVIKSETTDSVLLVGSDRVPHTLPKKDIKSRRASDVSIMPTGLVNGLKPNEFADLIAFLESLRGVVK